MWFEWAYRDYYTCIADSTAIKRASCEGSDFLMIEQFRAFCTNVIVTLTNYYYYYYYSDIQSAYVHNKSVKAALGVKISAQDLEKAIAGSRLLVVGPDDDEEDLKDEVMSDLKTLLSAIDKSGRGVCVQASTLGSLEALLEFLRTSNIPVSGINIGPVHKKDIMRAATMLEKAKE